MNTLSLAVIVQILIFGQDHVYGCGVRPLDLSIKRNTRIVGGRNARYGESPWQVALFYKGRYYCGGVLIFSRWVLTAGHCAKTASDIKQLTVRLGEYDLMTDFPQHHVELGVKLKIIHEDFVNFPAPTNDVGLLMLEKDVEFSLGIQPICLPIGNESYVNIIGAISGWGNVKDGKPHIQQIVELPIISNKQCQEWMSKVVFAYIKDEWLCAGFEHGGKDACTGDSGSGLWYRDTDGRYYVIAISSGGLGCGLPYRPGVYTRVNNYTSWIVNNILKHVINQ